MTWVSCDRDIRKMKDTKKQFEKISEELDTSFVRNSQTQRSKEQECREAYNDLTSVKSCFAHISLDHVFEVICCCFYPKYCVDCNVSHIFQSFNFISIQ